METSEFAHYFKKVPHLNKHFVGVFPIDKIPKSFRNKTFFVCNTDPSTKSGSHWIAFIKIVKGECEIFDSLGTKINALSPYFKFYEKVKFVYNTTPFQSKNSILCGKFVITFIVQRMLNQTLDFEELLEDVFSSDLSKNDSIVNDFCNNLD